MQVTANGSVNWFAATASRGRSTCRIAWSTLSEEAVLAGSGGRQAPDLAHEPIERCLDIVLREGRRYMAAFKLVDVKQTSSIPSGDVEILPAEAGDARQR
jgi:hypothetical protein